MKRKYDPIKLFLEIYNYDVWFQNEKLTDKEKSTHTRRKSEKEESSDVSDMPALEVIKEKLKKERD